MSFVYFECKIADSNWTIANQFCDVIFNAENISVLEANFSW